MKLFSWLRSVTRRGKVESDMDAELLFHIESYASDLVKAGMSEEEAKRRAWVEFGNVEVKKDECRASLGLRLWDEFCGDFVYGTRMLRRSPGFAAVAIISLALGIGANTAIFSLANEVLYKTMGVAGSDRLRILNWVQHPKSTVGHAWGSFNKTKSGEMSGSPFPYPLYLDWRKRTKVMEDLVAFKDVYQLTVSATSGAESVDGQLVSGNFYQVLGAKLIAGRPIVESDLAASAPPVAVISDAYWLSRFGRSVEVLGKTIKVNATVVTIIGVNSPAFLGAKAGDTPEIFLPITLQPRLLPRPTGSLMTDKNFWWVILLGRFKPDISPESLRSAAETEFYSSLRATMPEKPAGNFPGLLLVDGGRGFDLQTQMFARPLHVLLCAAALVLLVACVNLANLLLARGAARQREISVRLAMGAGRFRIFRQVLTESLSIAIMGGAAGLVLGYACRNVLPALFEESWRKSSINPQFDWKVFVYALGITLLTGLLFGLIPAARLNGGSAGSVMKETSRMSAGRGRALLGKSLVVLQIGLSVVLLIGAGLFVRTLGNLKSVPIGFNPQRLLFFEIDPPSNRYSGAQRVALFRQIEEKLMALRGVQAATFSSEPLLANSMDNGCVRPTGKPAGTGNEDYPWINRVGESFFQTLEMPIVMGRSFNWKDNQHGALVAIVNRALAAKLFPHESPIGMTVNSCEGKTLGPPIQIVGVAADARYASIDAEVPPTIFLPYLQQDDASGTFEIRTAASTQSMLKLIREVVDSVDRDLPLLDVRTQTQQIDATLTEQRMFASLTSGFGLLALLLAGIGIYGIMAYHVARRTNEIGIRMALGAQAQRVLGMILADAWLLAGLGVVAGVAAALAVTRVLAAMLYGVKPNDPLNYIGACVVFLVTALLAGAIPARRAAAIDPCEALRHE
jgi:predicted permease